MTILSIILVAVSVVSLAVARYYYEKYKDKVERQKHVISIPSSEFMGIQARRLVQFVDLKNPVSNHTIGMLEKQGYTYRREYDKGEFLCFVKNEEKKGVVTVCKQKDDDK